MRYLSGPVREVAGDDSRWTLLSIRLGMDEKPDPSCVLAQERYEQGMARFVLLVVGLAVGLPVGFLLPEIGWFVGLLLGIASGAGFIHLPFFKRWLELRGTAITIALAVRDYGEDIEEYEGIKARDRSGYGMFKGWPQDRIKAAFVKLRPWAMKNSVSLT